jgi:KDO2-lipid IV(A) lauroyltransferase
MAFLARALPEPIVRRVFTIGADDAWRRRGRGVRQLERNLRRVVGPALSDADLSALARRGMRSYARYWLEFFRLPALSQARIVGRMSVGGKEHLDTAMAAGRGAILALPHSGNWDHAGAWVAAVGYPFTTVAERLEPASLFDRFVAVRERLGMEVLPLTGDRGSFALLARRLREGRLVCLVCERDLSGSGVEVSFFGELMTMPGGPASLAVATGAALLPVTVWFTDDGGRAGGGWGGIIRPPLEPRVDLDRKAQVADLTQRLADAFATEISRRPQDWHMLQPLWPTDRPSPRADRAAADRPPTPADDSVAETAR